MVGHYRIVDDKIIGVMKTQKSVSSTNNSAPRFGKRRRNSLFTQYVPEQEFHYVSEKWGNDWLCDISPASLIQEFQVRGRRHNQLHWMRYQIVRLGSNGGEDTRTDLDISNGQTFPTLHFSRVKSYTVESENSLMWVRDDQSNQNADKTKMKSPAIFVLTKFWFLWWWLMNN